MKVSFALARSAPRLSIGSVQYEGSTWIRFAPFDTPNHATAEQLKEYLVNFTTSLRTQIEALNATNIQRPRLLSVLQEPNFSASLQSVVVPNWAGLGAVRYIPTGKDSNDSNITWTNEKINSVNGEIVKRLRVNDSAFSMGKAPIVDIQSEKVKDEDSSLICIRFGLVTAETDVEQLCLSVYQMGKNIEEEIYKLEEMSTVLRNKIQEASKELEKEQAVRAYEEGLLRHMPVVGSLLNWWSPPSGVKPIVGRRLNLSSGRLSPTSAAAGQPSPPASPTMSLNMHQDANDKDSDVKITTTDEHHDQKNTPLLTDNKTAANEPQTEK